MKNSKLNQIFIWIKKNPPIETRDNFKNTISEAIKSGNLDNLVNLLGEVNELLTGQPKDEFEFDAGFEELKQNLAIFFQKVEQGQDAEAEVYLGDGGYSRLVLKVVGGQTDVSLRPVSRSEVKEKWAEIE